MLSRRGFLRTMAQSGLATGVAGLLPSWAQSASAGNVGLTSLRGSEFHLSVDRFTAVIDGKVGNALGINGSIPAPLIRFREGDDIAIHVTNHMDSDTSIHWHGLLVPFHMDGIPGISFPGIRPGETFTYRFAVPQNGTYWYHSHSGLQEQLGMYGPLIIEPRGADPVAYDREYVLVLSDWMFRNPYSVYRKLKAMSETFNFSKRTLSGYFNGARRGEPGAALADFAMWARMRMSPRDIADVTGATYDFLINGHTTNDNWNGVFQPGERVRLRIINASAMTHFNVRIPGLPMTIVQTDGLHVQPLEVDEFQIGVAETYDAIIEPTGEAVYAFVAEAMDRSGQAVATLATRPGMRAEAPALRAVPTLTMKDMGMGDMQHGMQHDMQSAMPNNAGQMEHAAHSAMPDNAGQMQHAAQSAMPESAEHMQHAAQPAMPDAAGHMQHTMPESAQHAAQSAMPDNHAGHMAQAAPSPMSMPPAAATDPVIERGPGVMNLAASPVNRLDEPGTGLEDVPHRALRYSQLRSLEPNPDTRAPERELQIHLTGNMERYIWSFNGQKFSEITEPIVLYAGERVRLTMTNHTMMNHPVHLHGMFVDLVNGGGDHCPRKHTVTVKPGERLSVDVSPDASHIGDWALHCHLLFHMFAGMMHVVSVVPRGQA